LYIIDVLSSDVIQIIRKLRERVCLLDLGLIPSRLSYACHRLQVYRTDLHNTNLNLTSEQTDMLNDRIKSFELQRKELEPELANITEQLKLIYDARKCLNFFYPT
jgi:hypothetical protein